MSNRYLDKSAFLPALINDLPPPNLGTVIVIPCFNEDHLLRSLESIRQCQQPKYSVEVIVVINQAADVERAIHLQNQQTFREAVAWSKDKNEEQLRFHILWQQNLPRKKAGVGLARKIGMDEAVRRLERVGRQDGIIACYDADTWCSDNYLVALENHFDMYPDIQAASIWYEHPLHGDEFDEATYQAIAEYELHLRYFLLAKRYAEYPHAFETIGSSMAVRSNAYQQQGGMNTKKAGEDFYFLNKFITLGKLNELNTTMIIPSPRISDRVPFGTGKAVGERIGKSESLTSYAWQSFEDLKLLKACVPLFYKNPQDCPVDLPKSLVSFFDRINAWKSIQEIKQNTSDLNAFEKRFFRWFDPFKLMKFVHFARDHFYPNIPVVRAGELLLRHYFGQRYTGTARELLIEVRRLQKQQASPVSESGFDQ